MKKKIILLLLCCLILPVFSGCQSAVIEFSANSAGSPAPTPPAPVLGYEAPIGNIQLEQTKPIALYLPNKDRSKLVAITEEMSLPINRHGAESVIRSLLAHPGNDIAAPISPDVELRLSDYYPVEVSRDIATVNLTQSALQLSANDLYLVSQAIANTLSSFSDISYVNVLVMGKQIGLDTADTLPMGTLQERISSDLITLWEQIQSRRVLPNESAESKRLSLPVTLYFPIQSGLGIIPEVRNIAFSGQTSQQLISTLLSELAKGSAVLENAPIMPDFSTYLLTAPAIEPLQSTPGRKVSLHFSSSLYNAIIDTNNTLSTTLAALNYTLTTFLPNVVAVEVSIGDEGPIEKLNPQSPYLSVAELTFQDGLQKRSDFTPFLLSYADLYFPHQNSDHLVKVVRPVPYYEAKNPSYLISQLISGPKYYDSRRFDIQGFFTAEPAFSEGDIRGISYTPERKLLVHFSSSFFNQLSQVLPSEKEHSFIYSLVNTLCENPAVYGVCFFIDDTQPPNLLHTLYLPGTFYPNTGIVSK